MITRIRHLRENVHIVCLVAMLGISPWGHAADGAWEQAGYSAGGLFPVIVADPGIDHVVYLGSDVSGVYKSVDAGGKLPNAWGLYDMSGNVWEWCQDWYHSSYTGAPTDGSAWESPSRSNRVIRGGSWSDSGAYCRSASRYINGPDNTSTHVGFRLAKD